MFPPILKLFRFQLFSTSRSSYIGIDMLKASAQSHYPSFSMAMRTRPSQLQARYKSSLLVDPRGFSPRTPSNLSSDWAMVYSLGQMCEWGTLIWQTILDRQQWTFEMVKTMTLGLNNGRAFRLVIYSTRWLFPFILVPSIPDIGCATDTWSRRSRASYGRADASSRR